MDDIKAWLNNRVKDYDAGVRLYVKHGRDKSLIALFTQEEETLFKTIRLHQALMELLQPPPLVVEADVINDYEPELKPVCQPVPFTIAHKGWPNPINDPVLQALFDQWRPLYAALMSAQHRVYEVALQAENGNTAKEMEACQLAHQIIDLDNQLDDIYARRNHFLQHGHLPELFVEKEVVGDPVRWATERQNAMRYIREYRTKIKKDPTNKLVPKWEQKIQDWQKEVERYNRLLKLDDQ